MDCATPPSFDRPCSTTALAPTLFHEEWWLLAATNDRIAFAEARSGGRLVGRLPYSVTSRRGMPISTMPTLTHFLGPAVDDGPGNLAARTRRQREITRDLIQALPRLAYFRTKCHRDVPDVLMFQQLGFESSVQFTHELMPRPEPEIWAGLRDKTRNVIRRSADVTDVVAGDDAARFVDFYAKNLNAQERRSYLDLAACRRLIGTAIELNRGHILWTRRRGAADTAGAFCAWDDRVMYFLMSTRGPAATNGDVSRLVWEFAKFAAARRLVFDLDGVYSRGTVLFYDGFGAVTRPRYVVSRATGLARLVLADLIRRPNPFQA